MPKKRRKRTTSGTRRKKITPRKKQNTWDGIEFSISPETSAEITAIVFVLFGLLSLLSLFGIFGSLGEYIYDILRQIFGWMSYAFSIFLIIFGYILFYPKRYKVLPSTYIGFILINVLFPTLVHVFIKIESSFELRDWFFIPRKLQIVIFSIFML